MSRSVSQSLHVVDVINDTQCYSFTQLEAIAAAAESAKQCEWTVADSSIWFFAPASSTSS